MLTAHDRAQMTKALAMVRRDNLQPIVIRRRVFSDVYPEGTEFELVPQWVRIARLSSGSASASKGEGSEVTRQRCLVVADKNADIQVHDRFNDENGSLYIVNAIRPNRLVQLSAEAEVVS